MKRSDNIGLGAAIEDAARATEEAKLPNAIKALKGAGLLPVTGSDLLAQTFAPVEWIVEDLIAARGATSRGFKGDIIAGAKMRKTFFTLHLAACVAAGVDFLKSDTFAGFKVPKPRRVLYLNLELREDFAQERLKWISNQLGADLSNLEIMSPAKPYLLRNRYQLDRRGNPELVEGFEDELLEYIHRREIELTLADPEYKLLFPEEDENTGQGIGGILRWTDRIVTETGSACARVHHDNKGGGKDLTLTSRGSGSGFAGRDYDFRFALDAHADGDPEHEVLECGSRVRKDPEPVTLVFDLDTLTFSADPETPAERKSAKPPKLTPAEKEEKARKAAEDGARAIFAQRAAEVEARAEREGRDPEPVEYLLPCGDFKSKLAIRANLGRDQLKDQYKRLLEAGIVAYQGKLKRENGETKLDGATIYHGLPVHIEEYRKGFDLDARGGDLRGGIKSRPTFKG